MNQNNELLEYIYKSASMGKKSIEDILKNINNKDNKIKNELEKELKEYEDYFKTALTVLKKNKIKPKDSLMTEMMSKIGINLDLMNDNSDSNIASMILQGLTMGTIEMNQKIKDYEKVCDKKYINLAKELLEMQENNIEQIKRFL